MRESTHHRSHGHHHSHDDWHEAIEGEERPGCNLEELAQLIASSSISGYADLPAPLLQAIFQIILDQYEAPKDLVAAWQPLALTCSAWRSALLGTPVGLELKTATHISNEALSWMAKTQMEFLLLVRSLELNGADARLLREPDFQRNSARSLRSLVNVGPQALPLLPSFANLQQVTIFEPAPAVPVPRSALDVQPLKELPKLHCLTIAGHFGGLFTAQLPTKLRHLTLSLHSEGAGLDLDLPKELSRLEYLSAKADYLLVDWADVCQRCVDVTLCAETAMMRCGTDQISLLQQQPGGGDGGGGGGAGGGAGAAAVPAAPAVQDPQMRLYRQFGACAAEGEELEQATIAFYHLALYSGQREAGASLVDADDFLETLRADLLGSFDVDPSFESFPSFVRDQPAEQPCFVLCLEWQGSGEEGAPRSFHFTTPLAPSERALLLSQPVWQLAWCRDPAVRQILPDPGFISRSGSALNHLTNIPLWRGADLTPFTALKVLMLLVPDAQADAQAAEMAAAGGPAAMGAMGMGMGGPLGMGGPMGLGLGPGMAAGGAAAAGGGPFHGDSDIEEEESDGEGAGEEEESLGELLRGVRLPEGLESLCLSAEGVEAPRDFSADWLPPLPRLGEFGLFNFRGHDLRALPAATTCVRIMNPRLPEGEAAGGPAHYTLPAAWREAAAAANANASGSGGGGGNGSEKAGQPAEAEQEQQQKQQQSGGAGEGGSQGVERLPLSRASSGASEGSFTSAHSMLSSRPSSPGGTKQGPAAARSDGGGEEGCPTAAERPASDAAAAAEPAHRNASASMPGASQAADGSNSSSGSNGGGGGSSGSGGGRRRPQHHHHHHEGRGGHEEGGPGGEGHQCTDPNCPLHSGKRFLQLSFTDNRERAAVDLGALAASGAAILTLTCMSEAAPTALELRLSGSLRQLLRTMEAAGVDTLELTFNPTLAFLRRVGPEGASTQQQRQQPVGGLLQEDDSEDEEEEGWEEEQAAAGSSSGGGTGSGGGGGGGGLFGVQMLLQSLLSAAAAAQHAQRRGGQRGRRMPFLTGLRRLAEVGGERWEVKSFDGETIHESVVDSAKSWALLRKKPAAAA